MSLEKKEKPILSSQFDRLVLKKLAAGIIGFIPAYLSYRLLDFFLKYCDQKAKATEGCFYFARETVGVLLRDAGFLMACGIIFCLTALAVERMWDRKKLVKKNEGWKLASLGFGWLVTLIFILVSGRNYLCLKNNEIVDQSIFGKRGIYEWTDVSYIQTDCRYTSSKRGGRHSIMLALVLKSGQSIEAWAQDLKNLGYLREEVEGLRRFYLLAKEKNIPIIRPRLNRDCRDKFLDFALIGPPQVYDEPEIWELIKEVFVGKENV